MRRTPIAGAACAALLLAAPISAQQPATTGHVPIPVVEPRAADVATIDGIVSAFYDVISGAPGEPRQWGRDATLYLEPIFFTITTRDGSGRPRARTISKQEYVDRTDAWLVEHGFEEREIHRQTLRFGDIAYAWSTYEWTSGDGGTGRDINGIQLFHDGERWWITHATWDEERPGAPIPPAYLP